MEQNQELTFYYVENKCPSQNINGNLALYPISMGWAFGNLNAGWDIWIYLVSRRPQKSLIHIIFLNYLLNTKCLKVY